MNISTSCPPAATALAGIAMSVAAASAGFAQVEYDSAGVTVLHNPLARETSLRWTVGPEPLVEIGGAADDARYQLFRVADAAWLSDGRIVVADGGSQELRFYDGHGGYVSAVGREGEGPGEFRLIEGLEVGANDSIYVFDSQLQRVSIFDAGGRLARDLPVLPSTAPAADVGRFADGRWYARDEDRFQQGPPGAIRRDTAEFIGLSAAFEGGALIAALPGMMTAIFHGAAGEVSYAWAPFSPSPLHDVFGNCLYVTAGDDFGLRIFSSDGRLVRLVRNDGERRAVTEAHRTGWADVALAQVPEAARSQVRRVMERIPTPDELPVYNDVIVDAQGYIWLQAYMPPAGSGRRWIVLGPTGRLLGPVEMPVVLDVFEIGPDYVLGRWRDEIGEEFVRVYPLRADRDPLVQPPIQCRASGGMTHDGSR